MALLRDYPPTLVLDALRLTLGEIARETGFTRAALGDDHVELLEPELFVYGRTSGGNLRLAAFDYSFPPVRTAAPRSVTTLPHGGDIECAEVTRRVPQTAVSPAGRF